jgi:hypothetical protein
MSVQTTIGVLIATLIVFGFANYKARQPIEPGEPRWVPYVGIQFVSVVAMVYMIIYLIQY